MTEQLCKLTRQDMTTYGGFRWVTGKWVETLGEGNLCGPGWIHCYTHPLLAVALNPSHANFKNPRLWEIETSGARKDDRGLKLGVSKCRLVKELMLPEVSRDALIHWAIKLSLLVHDEPKYMTWANRWLDGSDRTKAAGATAARTATGAGAEAAWAAATAAEWAGTETAAEAAALAAALATAEAREELPLLQLLEEAIAKEHGS